FMAVLYVSTGYTTVIQSESLAILPFIVLIRLQLDEHKTGSWYKGILTGVVGAVLTGLKITLGSVLLVIAIVDIIDISDGSAHARSRSYVAKWAGIAAGFVGASLIIWRVFAQAGAFDGYLQLVSFTKSYAGIPAWDGVSLRFAWKSIATYYFDHYSIALAVMALVGVRIVYSAHGDRNSPASGSERRLLRLLVLMFVMMLVTVVIERKFFPYHFIRTVVPLTIFSAYGFHWFLPWMRKQWRQGNERLLLVIASVMMIVWSPLARMVPHINPVMGYVRGGTAYDSYYQRSTHLGMFRIEEQRIHDSIMAVKKPDDHVLVAALNSPRLALQCGDGGWSFIAGSQFALADYSSSVWRLRFADEMRRARWLVAGLNDSNQYFNTPPKTSMQILSEREEFRGIVQHSFAPRWHTEHFVVFERLDDSVIQRRPNRNPLAQPSAQPSNDPSILRKEPS
ncbi:MAG: hypothetical protein ACKO9V_01370, partial [Candidatus Kapaibacterium sp.]